MLYRLCRVRETSPGTHTFFHTYACPVYCWRSVQFLDFGLFGSLIHASQPVRDSCSSGQRFASSFLQTHTSRWRPCLWLHPSHCRADQGLSPLRTCARRAHHKESPRTGLFWACCGLFLRLLVLNTAKTARRFPDGHRGAVFCCCLVSI